MSLSCGNCNEDVGPGSDLPGRESVLLTPVVPASLWTIEVDGTLGSKTQYALGDARTALCLECVQKQVPADRLALLERFYRLYRLEKAFGESYSSIGGTLPISWSTVTQEEYNHHRTAPIAKSLSETRKTAYEDGLFRECLFCSTRVYDNKPVPYFQARGIDRVLCSRVLSGISFPMGNYSLSFLHQGLSGFPICFRCYARLFPTSFVNLTTGLGNSKLLRTRQPVGELVLSSRFVEKLMEEGTPESLKAIGEQLEQLAEEGALKIDLNE